MAVGWGQKLLLDLTFCVYLVWEIWFQGILKGDVCCNHETDSKLHICRQLGHKACDTPANCSDSVVHDFHSKPLTNFGSSLTELKFHLASFLFVCLIYLSTCITAFNCRTCLHPTETTANSIFDAKKMSTTLFDAHHWKTNQGYICIRPRSAKWRALQLRLCGFLTDWGKSLW